MKFTSEKGLGRRRTRPKSQEFLRSVDEPKEQALFPWFDPAKHAQLIHEVQSNIPDTPVELPMGKEFYQAKFELAYFLSVLCANHAELLDIPDKQIKEAAQKAYKQTHGEVDPLGILAGMVDLDLRRRIQAESVSSIQRRIDQVQGPGFGSNIDSKNLEIVFCLRLVAPDQVRWVARGIHTNPLEYGGEAKYPGVFIIPAAAKLSVIWPQRKDEFLRAITPEHIQQYKDHTDKFNYKHQLNQ